MTGPVAWVREVTHFESPTLRVRYRAGLGMGVHGFPDWVPYARAAVQLPVLPVEYTPQTSDTVEVTLLGVDEARVLDVLTANAVLEGSGDPLWTDLPPLATPPGWTWAHLELCRTLVLVPIELYLASRHRGGVATGAANQWKRGLPGCSGPAPEQFFHERLAEVSIAALEERVGPLPPAYRRFLIETNGAAPEQPAVHPRFGFVFDQPLFGLARQDPRQDLGLSFAVFTDRFTDDLLPIGYVHGGMLALRLRGEDAGSVWYHDSDDHRERAELTAAEVSRRLLHRCADDFDAFWGQLCPIPAGLRSRAFAAADGAAWPVTLPRMGSALPPARRGTAP